MEFVMGEIDMGKVGGFSGGGGGGVVRFENGSFMIVSRTSDSGMVEDGGEDTFRNVSIVGSSEDTF